ncbi:MAG TPA: HDIG domain-containing protein [Candidatus Polarisedimenticolia bacterium]|nr:HDIG domain-containing protein [Candidatus Polarisedimenticolia bacterium]
MTPDPSRSSRSRLSILRGRAEALRTRLSDASEGLLASRVVWSILFLVALAPLLLGPRIGSALPHLSTGSIVQEDVVAPASLEFEDDATTREIGEAARRAILPVYDYDSRVLDDALAALHRLFVEGRVARDAVRGRAGGPATRLELARELTERRGLALSSEAAALLERTQFDPETEQRLSGVLRVVLRQRVIASRALLEGTGPVTLRDVRSGAETRDDPFAVVVPLDEARHGALAMLREAGAPQPEQSALGPLLSDLVTPNVAPNSALTETRRQEAAGRIRPLIVRVVKGTLMLRRGEVVSEAAARTLSAFNRAREAAASGRSLLGNLLFMLLLLFFMARYVFFYQKSYRKERHLFALLVVVTVVGLFLDRGFLWLYEHLVVTFKVSPYADPSFYRTMVPMAAGAMLVTLLVNPRVGMAYVLFYVPLFGMMMEWNLELLLFCLVSNLAGIYGVTTYRQRTALIKAGLALGGANGVSVMALQSVVGASLPATHLLFQILCGFAGGILVAVLVSFLLPLLEAMFNILTDVRLLELSNLNNPLLRRLAVEAPGSYNHSVIVGTLAEAAAESIGANALFCRVGAYYHDIGKMLKPDYYIENQRDGVNRHDTLSPQMSALVIASHVKEGYELGRRYGLPKQVLDIIPQHHGTRKINYFYQKARRSENPESDEVQESDFRYPGPKPQTREAAIFMLSDSIEAAARTLEDPSPARFKGLIRRIISDVVLDDQFDECDLTFSDLDKISGAFLKTLGSIYHHRIDYPGFEFDKIPERPFRGSRSHEDLPSHLKRWRS